MRSFAGTVGDLLDSEGIRYDVAHDLVTPAPTAELKDGETVAGPVRPAGAAHPRRSDPHGLDDGPHRVGGADVARRPGR